MPSTSSLNHGQGIPQKNHTVHFLLLAGVLLSGDRFAVDILLVSIIESVQRYVHVSIWEFN